MTTSIANELWAARTNGTLYTGAEHPKTISEAYELQNQTNKVAMDSSGEMVTGYKIGATTDEIMEMLGLSEPFYGPLYQSMTRENGSTVPVNELHTPKVEAEFVVCLSAPIARGNTRDITVDDVTDAIDWIAPAFEFIGTRFADTPTGRGLCAITDFGSNLDFVAGDPTHDWKNIDLASSPVTLNINGKRVAEGHSGMSKAGNPLAIVAWLLNQPALHDIGLTEGQLISCGTCTGAIAVAPGDFLEADYGPLGTITTTISVS